MEYLPGSGWKKINIYINDASHADLRIKLRYYDISQSEFLRVAIESLIEENPKMLNLILDKLENRKSARKKKKILQDVEEKEQIINDFALNQEEIENIFDILEKESEEL